MGVSLNGGTQQPWVFLLKMIILGCARERPRWSKGHRHGPRKSGPFLSRTLVKLQQRSLNIFDNCIRLLNYIFERQILQQFCDVLCLPLSTTLMNTCAEIQVQRRLKTSPTRQADESSPSGAIGDRELTEGRFLKAVKPKKNTMFKWKIT